MNRSNTTEMDEDERDEFLGTGGTGVLSFSTADDDPPRSVPVSYGYDATESTFYFRLAVGSEGTDRGVTDRAVTFVTYGRGDEEWRSVVATGRLEDTTEETIATQTLEGLERVHIPLVDIFGRPPRDVSFAFVRLVPDELTGRKESKTAP